MPKIKKEEEEDLYKWNENLKKIKTFSMVSVLRNKKNLSPETRNHFLFDPFILNSWKGSRPSPS